MGRNRFFCKLTSLLVACVITVCSFATVAFAETKEQTSNRFNVVIVLDASGSMRQTDPQGYRFEAISQFTGLLAEQGNVLGGVVFHTDIPAELAPAEITGQEGKDAVIEMLKSVPDNGGWTNTGAGLARAVEMIKANGDPNLPSVILFLSDGNTEMASADATKASLEQKADALQAAREEGITIYSVCLNANKSADVSEMQQLSDATGGVFQEVSKAQDLQDVFNMFYNLIYGTSTITLVDEVFPDPGILETTFDVPGLGVEEVNIIIYGNTTKKSLLKPDGTESDATSVDSDTFSMLKLTDVVPGTWTLVTEGVPGDSIKINMVYNTNLGIEVSVAPEGKVVNPADPITITAKLKGNNILATTGEQYIGYSAELQVLNAYDEFLESIPMTVVGDHFEVSQPFAEGTYFYKVIVTGNHIEKESEKVGPVTSTANVMTEAEKNNTPPVPINAVVEESVNIWPFKGGTFTLDMNTLATDTQDDTLHYQIVSTSFIEGTDYTVSDDGILTMDRFSLSKGAYTIKATDSGGLSCEVEVIVKSYNIGLMALVGMIIIGLICASVFFGIVYKAAQRPWRGRLTVHNELSHAVNTRGDFRGAVPLKKFAIGNCGINGKFVAIGHNRLEFVSKKPVYPMRNGILGRETKRISIDGTITLYVNESRQGGIKIEAKPDTHFRGFGGLPGGMGAGHTGKQSQKKSKPSSSNPFDH